jgi:hypothetical protein
MNRAIVSGGFKYLQILPDARFGSLHALAFHEGI